MVDQQEICMELHCVYKINIYIYIHTYTWRYMFSYSICDMNIHHLYHHLSFLQSSLAPVSALRCDWLRCWHTPGLRWAPAAMLAADPPGIWDTMFRPSWWRKNAARLPLSFFWILGMIRWGEDRRERKRDEVKMLTRLDHEIVSGFPLMIFPSSNYVNDLFCKSEK